MTAFGLHFPASLVIHTLRRNAQERASLPCVVESMVAVVPRDSLLLIHIIVIVVIISTKLTQLP
eukprot:scaffold7167_cov165-Amphora_coffeaeformis.AAC.4